jgi:hypothetical protein
MSHGGAERRWYQPGQARGKEVRTGGGTVAAVGVNGLRSVDVDVHVRHRCLVDDEGDIVFGLLGTAKVRIVVPVRVPRWESQRAEGSTWTEGRRALEWGEQGNRGRRCRRCLGTIRGISICGPPSGCHRGVRRCTVVCIRARPPTRTSATEARPGGGGRTAIPIIKLTAPLPGPALGRHRGGLRCWDGRQATAFSC